MHLLYKKFVRRRAFCFIDLIDNNKLCRVSMKSGHKNVMTVWAWAQEVCNNPCGGKP